MNEVESVRQNLLPDSWLEIPIDQTAEVNRRPPQIASLSEDAEVTFVPMAAVDATAGVISEPKIARLSEVRRGYTSFADGDVIIAKITPSMENGKAAIATALKNGLAFGSTEFHVLTPGPSVLSEWLFYFVRREKFRADAKANFTGTAGQLRVPANFVAGYRIPLAPLAEQRRIVAAIEAHFTRLDAAVAALQRAQANLQRYRASVLKAACEGKLVPTEADLAHFEGREYEPADVLLDRILADRQTQWEAANPRKKYKPPTPPDTTNLPPLPTGWTWATLPQLGELNRGKSKHRPRNDPKLYDGPYPFIQTGDIARANGKITTFSATYNDFGLAQSRLWPEDTLCITIAANIADTAMLTFPACFPDSVVGFVADKEHCDVRYIEFYIRTVKNRLEELAPATAQKNINLGTLSALPIALPPRAEQTQISNLLDLIMSSNDALQGGTESNLVRASILRQSILERAFTGRLVPQDPNDEPAAALLARIDAQPRGELAQPSPIEVDSR